MAAKKKKKAAKARPPTKQRFMGKEGRPSKRKAQRNRLAAVTPANRKVLNKRWSNKEIKKGWSVKNTPAGGIFNRDPT